MKKKEKIYFASDMHLGSPLIADALAHEKRIVNWLDSIKEDATALYLLGDIFDFWFEYRHVVPRGFSRFLGKICELTDNGIEVHYFVGNHDLWVFDYLPNETGMIIHHKPYEANFNGKIFYMAHGDGLGPFDKIYKCVKKVFTNKIAQWMFSLVHPNLGIGFARAWSKQSRSKTGEPHKSCYLGIDREWLMQYAKQLLSLKHYDYFVFGHRHIAMKEQIGEKSEFIYLGDWLSLLTYGVWDGDKFELKKF